MSTPLVTNPAPPSSTRGALWIFALGLAGMFGIFGIAGGVSGANKNPGHPRHARFVPALLASAAFAALLVTASCAGTAVEPPAPQNKNYTITVTSTAAGGPTHMQTFALTITP
jgi:hypothetical protein